MSLQSQTRPAEVAFRFPKRFKRLLVPILFDETVLRTGDCLVRLSWCGRTFHLLPEKYSALKSCLDFKSEAKKPDDASDDKQAVLKKRVDALLVETDTFSDFQQRCRPDVLSDREWIFPTAEPFNAADWTNVSQIGMPAMPHPPPASLPNADDYRCFFIADIRKKTAAKTDKGLTRFEQKMKSIWTERKTQYDEGLRLLREAGFFQHTESVDGLIDCDRHACPRCGCTVFDKYLCCYDCGFKYFSEGFEPVETVSEKISHEQGNPPVRTSDRRGRRRNRMTKEEFAAAVVISGKWLKLARNPKELRSLKNSYLILCEGWLPRDVTAVTNEQLYAVERRSERLWQVLKEYRQDKPDAPLPFVTPEQIREMNSYVS